MPDKHNISPLSSTIIYLLIVVTLVYGWLSQKPADKAYLQADESQFSQQRAFAHIGQIAAQPHYVGTQAHSQVRDYLVAQLTDMGLNVDTQNTLALSPYYYRSAYVSNIVARLPANSSEDSQDRKALALVSHYDSALSSSPGASDAASGVAVILEVLRAFIASNQPHSNDIMVIITDAEELGLLGAQAFVDQHPWAEDIGLVLNFEARGSGGPSFMLLETNGGNQQLIEAFQQANVPYPMASSLMYSIYKMLPNDTDLTIFRDRADINGFNFAFIDDHFDYHTAQDSVERLDPASLNHQASYLIALLPVLTNLDLSTLHSDNDEVYVNLANSGLISFPFSWVMPLFVLATLLFLSGLIIGIWRKTLTFAGLLLSVLPALTSIASAGGIGYLCWQWSVALFPEFLDIPQGFTYSGHWLIALTILLTVMFNAAIYRWVVHKFATVTLAEWLVAPTLLWLVINGLIAHYLAGAGFFLVVLIAPLAALIYVLYKPQQSVHPIHYVLLYLPALLLLAPQIPVFVIGLGLSMLFIASLMTSLLLVLVLPLWVKQAQFKWLQRLLEVTALLCLLAIVLNTGYSSEQKKPSSLNYLLDSDTGQAYMFSFDPHLDVYSEQVLSSNDAGNELLTNLFPFNVRRPVTYSKEVPAFSLTPLRYQAGLTPLAENRVVVRLIVEPQQTPAQIQLSSDQPMFIESISVDGQAFASEGKNHRGGIFFSHQASHNKPILIEFSYAAEQDLNIRLLEIRYNLAEQMPGYVPRPAFIMPHPFALTDATIVSESLQFSLIDTPADPAKDGQGDAASNESI